MTTPTTLADWTDHCRTQAEQWDQISPLIRDHASDWAALGDLAYALSRVPPGWRTYDTPSLAAAVARLAAHLPTAATEETCWREATRRRYAATTTRED